MIKGHRNGSSSNIRYLLSLLVMLLPATVLAQHRHPPPHAENAALNFLYQMRGRTGMASLGTITIDCEPTPNRPRPWDTRCWVIDNARTLPLLTLICDGNPYPLTYGCVIPLFVPDETVTRWRAHPKSSIS
jgi:hypothetical protein